MLFFKIIFQERDCSDIRYLDVFLYMNIFCGIYLYLFIANHILLWSILI